MPVLVVQRHHYTTFGDYWSHDYWTKGYIHTETIRVDFERYYHGVSVQTLRDRFRDIPTKFNQVLQKQINESPKAYQKVLNESVNFYINWIRHHGQELVQKLEARSIKELANASVFYKHLSGVPADVK